MCEKIHSAGKTFRPEENPCNAHKAEGNSPTQVPGYFPFGCNTPPYRNTADQRFCDKHNSMNCTPYNKCPRRSMPQSAYKENDHEIPIHPGASFAAATQWNVQVVFEPCGQ